MTENSFDYIKYNLDTIREDINNAALKVNKNANDIKFLGATKTVEVAKINFAIENGLDYIGENRVQEMLEKYDDLNLANCNNHFIGRLQTNKIKYIADKVSLIHSIDTISQVKELQKQLDKKDLSMDILIEVNIGDEENKGGVNQSELYEFIDQAREYSRVHINGLMAVPPVSDNLAKKIKYFDKMYQYYIDISSKKLDNIDMNILSLGMSDDYATAIECGSNLVRIGSKLFGQRIYSKI